MVVDDLLVPSNEIYGKFMILLLDWCFTLYSHLQWWPALWWEVFNRQLLPFCLHHLGISRSISYWQIEHTIFCARLPAHSHPQTLSVDRANMSTVTIRRFVLSSKKWLALLKGRHPSPRRAKRLDKGVLPVKNPYNKTSCGALCQIDASPRNIFY